MTVNLPPEIANRFLEHPGWWSEYAGPFATAFTGLLALAAAGIAYYGIQRQIRAADEQIKLQIAASNTQTEQQIDAANRQATDQINASKKQSADQIDASTAQTRKQIDATGKQIADQIAAADRQAAEQIEATSKHVTQQIHSSEKQAWQDRLIGRMHDSFLLTDKALALIQTQRTPSKAWPPDVAATFGETISRLKSLGSVLEVLDAKESAKQIFELSILFLRASRIEDANQRISMVSEITKKMSTIHSHFRNDLKNPTIARVATSEAF